MYQKWTKNGQKMEQNGPKMDKKGQKMEQNGPKMDTKWARN